MVMNSKTKNGRSQHKLLLEVDVVNGNQGRGLFQKLRGSNRSTRQWLPGVTLSLFGSSVASLPAEPAFANVICQCLLYSIQRGCHGCPTTAQPIYLQPYTSLVCNFRSVMQSQL